MAYIALLDVIGFDELARNDTDGELSLFIENQLSELLEVSVTFNSEKNKDIDHCYSAVRYIELGDKMCSVARVKDSFIIYTDETYLEFVHLILSASRLSALLLLKGLPMKGVITSGDLMVDKEQNRVYGPGLESAKKMILAQNWAGVIIDSIDTPAPKDISRLFCDHEDMMRELVLSGVVCKYPGINDNEYELFAGWPKNFEKVPRKHTLKCFYNHPVSLVKRKDLTADLEQSIEESIVFFDWFQRIYQDGHDNNYIEQGPITDRKVSNENSGDINWDKSVFIAYASEDRKKAKKLYDDLTEIGLSPWMDIERLQVGDDWDSQIKDAITKCTAFFACISMNSIEKSGYIQRELRLALQELEKKPQGSRYLCPILLDDSEVPDLQVSTMNIRDYHAISYYDISEKEKFLDNLVSRFKLPERMLSFEWFRSNDREYTKKIRVSRSGRNEITNAMSFLDQGDLKSAIDILTIIRGTSPALKPYGGQLALLISKPAIARMFGKKDNHPDVLLEDKLTKEGLIRLMREALFLQTYTKQ